MTAKTDVKKLINRTGSERALITICLNNPDKIPEVIASGLNPAMFAVDGHKYIFMAMMYLNSEGKEVDAIAITNVFTDEKAKESIEELGGIEYIETMKGNPVAPNIELFTNHIIIASAKRRIYEESEAMMQRALKGEDDDLDSYLAEMESKLRDVSIDYQVAKEVYKMGTNSGDRLKERLLNPTPVIGLKTGWKVFDLATLGLKAGELTIVGARSKVGKSVTLLNWSRKIAVEDNIPVLYIDTEMYEEEQEDRLLAQISGVPEHEIKNGMFGKDTFNGKAKDKIKAVQAANKLLNSSNFFHVYMPHFTIEKVTALARKYQVQHNIQLLIFDYIKLPSSSGGKNNDAEYQRLGQFTSGLKDLAGLLKIPVISAVQLNRGAVGSEEINDSHIAGSDRILQLANRLCFLRNKTEEEYALEGRSAGNQKFTIAFQRGGASGETEINIQFDREIIRMQEAEVQA